jgi:hypothetical protein
VCWLRVDSAPAQFTSHHFPHHWQTVTWQILSGLGQAHAFRGGSSYPAPFSYFVNIIEVFMLDIFTFFHAECVAATTYADKLMVALLTVVALGVVSVVIGAIFVYMWGGTVLRSSSVKTYIVVIYIVLPTMSSMAFSAFNCDEVREGAP